MKIQFKILIFTAVLCLGALSFYFLSQKEQKVELFSYGEAGEVSDQAEVRAFKAAVEKANKKQVNTVEEFLKLLPDDLRNRYTLVYGSRSIQEASLTHPRALVFSKDVSVIYSFNGDPKQQGYHQIEIMYLDYKTGKVEMQEIRFSGGEGSPFPETVVENNPEACIGCHGTERSLSRTQNLKPIWDNYFVWPGVYGSIDDDLWRIDFKVGSATQYDNPLSLEILNFNEDHPELVHFKSFFKNKSDHQRYSKLTPNLGGIGVLDLDGEGYRYREVRPNLYFSKKFVMILALQAAELLLKSPEFVRDYKQLRSLYEGSIWDESVRQQLKGARTDAVKILELYYNNLFHRQKLYLGTEVRFGRASNDYDMFNKAKFISSTKCVHWLIHIENNYNLNLRKFSMDHYPKSYLNHQGNNEVAFCEAIQKTIEDRLSKSKSSQ